MDQPKHDDNAPEFHDRFSIHPQSVDTCRKILLEAAESWGTCAEEEVEAFSDWECMQRVEGLMRAANHLAAGRKQMARSFSEAAAALSGFTDAFVVGAGQQLAEETELFLAIDHSA